jgi:2-polyprenyl-6-methoxyphenol hydroxylase-like FAD-dependent oxidoreductase
MMVSSAGTQPRLNHRAIVIGGSIAGLFVAAFLRRVGWQVDIYNRSARQSSSSVAASASPAIWNCLRLWTNVAPALSILA